ncbi:MAG: hypothetical protein JRJ27_10150 [Deltaproteobacteria bacterium]|nr:hypothetical protein [Deltaproteobacteria bacterium]
MKAKTIIRIAVCIVSIALLALPGCGGKPFVYNPPSEIPEGPGILSGKDGEFTLYDSKSGKVGKESKAAVEAGASASEISGAEKTGGVVAAGEKMPDSKEYLEFQDFQEWKKDKREFKDFQEWKKSKQGAKEYQEFQEWKKWKEFKKWQEDQ